jgi:hypothetical protein
MHGHGNLHWGNCHGYNLDAISMQIISKGWLPPLDLNIVEQNL